MSLSVSASRFACLPDDESADWKGPKSKTKNKKEDNVKKSSENKAKDQNKLKAQKEAKELQNIAFGGQKKKKKKGSQQQATPQTPSKSSTPKEVSPPVEDTVPDGAVNGAQYDEWQKKDKIQAEDNFSQAMQEAILLSKLEFEQQEAEIAAQKRLMVDGSGNPGDEQLLASMSKEDRKKVAKAGKAASVMSLDQFNASEQVNVPEAAQSDVQPGVYKHPRHKDRGPGECDVQPPRQKDKLVPDPKHKNRLVPVNKTENSKPDFFNQTDQAALKAINREQLMDSFRNQEVVASESAMVANYKEKFLAKETEVNLLRSEVADLKEKMTDCKTRSKKLTEILMTGEMKEKTEVLLQVQQLEKVRDELTSSLSATAGLLEQERSLNRILELELKRLSLQEVPLEKDVVNRLLAIIRAKK